jgi:uncharacterized LabA/DUF88 family protein
MGKYDFFVKLINDYDKAEKQELKFEEDENGEQEHTVPQKG